MQHLSTLDEPYFWIMSAWLMPSRLFDQPGEEAEGRTFPFGYQGYRRCRFFGIQTVEKLITPMSRLPHEAELDSA